jgi:hypothetical protein
MNYRIIENKLSENEVHLPSRNGNWKPIRDIEGLYEISSTGQIRSLKREIIVNGKKRNKF